MSNINKYIFSIFEAEEVIKVVEKKNYVVSDYKGPKKKNIVGYRRKVIHAKDGRRVIINLALTKKDGKVVTKKTSVWRPKPEHQVRDAAVKQEEFNYG